MKVVGISGRKGAGKTTVASYLANHANRVFGRYEVARMGFADPIKRICNEILGVSYRSLYGSDAEKNEPTSIRWNQWPDSCRFSSDCMTGREVMQQVGTFFRKINPDIWVDSLFRLWLSRYYEVLLIDDVRFPNEVEGIHKRDGLVIRLARRGDHADPHVSETALDGFKGFDLVVPADADRRATFDLVEAAIKAKWGPV